MAIIRERTNSDKIYVASIAGIKEAFGPVFREGNTPDVYCKIAEAASEYGLSVDIKPSMYHGMAMGFSRAKPGYKKPSPKTCEAAWNKVKKIDDMIKKEGPQKFFLKHPEFLE